MFSLFILLLPHSLWDLIVSVPKHQLLQASFFELFLPFAGYSQDDLIPFL
jgi:hypothetical protein